MFFVTFILRSFFLSPKKFGFQTSPQLNCRRHISLLLQDCHLFEGNGTKVSKSAVVSILLRHREDFCSLAQAFGPMKIETMNSAKKLIKERGSNIDNILVTDVCNYGSCMRH